MIMDDGINVDDLFGESASLELGLPAPAPTSNSTKGLAQRLDEMRLLGCCHLAGQRQAAFDPIDDGAQIVGMMWLNVQRSVHAFNVAAMVQGRRAYSPFRRRPIGPFHPAGKAALLCVTRSGVIRLLYQNPDNKWAEISAELKNASYSDRLLTHAAIVATQNGILIATYSACQKIYFYRVQINWTPPQWDPSQLKQAPNQFPVPGFRFMHSKVEAPCIIPSASRNGEATSDELPPSTNPLYCLTRLDIVLAAHDNSAGMTTNPWIIAVFSIPPHATPDHSQQPSPCSVIVRWQLESAPQVLHPKFDEPKSVLRRLEDMYCDRYVTTIEQTEHGNVLAVTYDDSSVTFYDPKTMAVLNGTDDTNTLSSLAHAGFHYPPDSAGLHISFSPSGCNAVTLDGEGQAQLRVMEHSYGAENGLYDENAQTSFINEVYRALGVNCNYTQENDKLMSHQYLPKCLSVQAALGFIDKYKSRNFASNVPWTILQLRHASVLYALFLQYLKGGVQAEPPDAVNGRIPPVLVTAVSTILRQTVPTLKPEIDRMAIYIGDYSWLGLGSDPRAELYRRTRDVDIIKKIPFRSTTSAGSDGAQSGKHNPSQVRRRCVRCCEIMCGAYPPRPQLSSRMMYKLGYVRYCICGGGWTLESDLHR
ncbi:hypothetical protein APSETT445_004173 [Aspergillus pseudonomiae]